MCSDPSGLKAGYRTAVAVRPAADGTRIRWVKDEKGGGERILTYLASEINEHTHSRSSSTFSSSVEGGVC